MQQRKAAPDQQLAAAKAGLE